MRNLLFILISFVLLTPIDAFAQKKGKKGKKNKNEVIDGSTSTKGKDKKYSDDKKEEFAMDAFTEGMKHFILQDYEKAISHFKESEKFVSSNSAVHYQLAYSHMKLAKFNSALEHAKKSLELDKSNQYYYGLLAQIHKYNHQYVEATEVYKQRIQNIEPLSEDFYLDLAEAQMFAGKQNDALKTYDDAEVEFGLNEMVIRQKQKIYLRSNKTNEAIKEGDKLVDAFPENKDYMLDQVQLLMTTQNTNKAVVILEKLLADNPGDPKATFLLSDVYKIKGEHEKSAELLREAFRSPDLDESLKLDILGGYLRRSSNPTEQKNGLELSKVVLEAHPESPKAISMYADFLITTAPDDLEIKKEVRDLYGKATKMNGNDYNNWRQMIGLDWELEEMDSIVKHTEDALEYFPNQIMLHLQNGAANATLKNYEEAEATLSQAKMLAAGNKEVLVQLDSYLGDVYYNLKEFGKSDAAFESVLDIDPKNIHALNNYSYYLSLRKENLEKAKEMGKFLVTLEPENDTYLDTYGWVLFVNGDYKEAKQYLEKAASTSKSADVLSHYGDVLFKLGEKEQAVEQWKKALEFGDSENPKLLERKIQAEKLVE
ncbi:MAG: tetratricopeptide (TPR) repeat protein [Flammeovirgaceae bacterium]|jgi:tetratricopeptide (TPR) repeat protein